MVDGLDLADLGQPHADILRGGHQHPVTVVLGLSEDRLQILDPGHHSDGHLPPLGRGVRARVERGSESFADLLDLRLELVTLEEDDEDRLVHRFSLELITLLQLEMTYGNGVVQDVVNL